MLRPSIGPDMADTGYLQNLRFIFNVKRQRLEVLKIRRGAVLALL